MNFLVSSIVSRYKFCLYDLDNQQLHSVLDFQSFHIKFSRVKHIPTSSPLYRDWYIKSIQQDTDAEAALGYREGSS